jgi:brefeldin A-resistance guanine nucleotide exchange factor 1
MKDPNRPKKVKKTPKAAAKSTTEETSESKEAVTSTTSEKASKSEETAVTVAASEEASNAAATKSDDEANKFVNIENIQVNVSNEESKLCSTPAAEHQVSVDGGATSGGEETLQSSSSAAVLEEAAARKPSESESSSSKVGGEETAATNVENQEQEYVNPRGVRFVQESAVVSGSNAANMPYGLPCVRELLRFLISLIGNKNSDLMISMGLNLITIGLESGIDHIASYQSLLAYVKDDLCRNLYNLLSVDRLSIYTNVLRVTFLLFESLRGHLKLQLEHFMLKLMEIIISESNRISNEQKEITLDFLVQILRIPGFAIEIYLNYDCSLNSTNLFEDLTKLLSKVNNFFNQQ